MTTELKKAFFSVFGIEQEYQYHVRDMGRSYVGNKQMLIDNKHLFLDKERRRSRRLYVANVSKIYPEITAEKLLQMICIYNEFQNNCDEFFIPTNINTLKEKFLMLITKVIKDKIANRYFCNDVEKFKHQIQQLFNEDDTHKSTMLNIITDDEY